MPMLSKQRFHVGAVPKHHPAAPAAAGPPRPDGPATLVELLRLRAAAGPDTLAYEVLEDGEERSVRLSLADLDRRARHVAAVLQSAGAAGEPVVLLFTPGVEYVTAFWGCLYAGAVAVPAYPPQSNQHAARIQRILRDAGARLVLTSGALRDPLAAQMASLSVRVLAPFAEPDDAASAWSPPRIAPDALAFLQYTSGSTGSPRGVMLTHSNLLHNSEFIRRAFEIDPTDRMVSWLPPYHDMGLIGGILQPVYAGCSTVLMTPVHFLQRPVRWLRAISRHRATISGGPNFAYDLCLRKVTPEQRAGLDLSSWQVALNGAEPVLARTLERFARTFAEHGFRARALYPCYGLAEATLMAAGGRRGEPPVVRSFEADALEAGRVRPAAPGPGRALVGCGHPHMDQRIRIVNPDTGAECAPDEIGEIWVSGPSVARGYWRRAEESERTFAAHLAGTGEGPFLRTGDLGFLDGGELFVAGRIKDLIIIRGRNHYPQDIEDAVAESHPALRPGGGAAFSVPVDDEESLVVVHEVQRTAARTVDREEVAKAVRTVVAEAFRLQVHDIVLLHPTGLPKTSSGKVQRRACRQQYLERTLPALPVRPREEGMQR